MQASNVFNPPAREEAYHFDVALFTSEWLFKGSMYPNARERLTDILNNPNNECLSLADCTVRSLKRPGEEYETARTVSVKRDAVLLAIPYGDIPSRDRLFIRGPERSSGSLGIVELIAPPLMVRGTVQLRGGPEVGENGYLRTAEGKAIQYTESSPFVPLTDATADVHNNESPWTRRSGVVIVNMAGAIASLSSVKQLNENPQPFAPTPVNSEPRKEIIEPMCPSGCSLTNVSPYSSFSQPTPRAARVNRRTT